MRKEHCQVKLWMDRQSVSEGVEPLTFGIVGEKSSSEVSIAAGKVLARQLSSEYGFVALVYDDGASLRQYQNGVELKSV